MLRHIVALVLAFTCVSSVALAEPVEGPSKAYGELEPNTDAQIPISLLPGESTILIWAEEDNASLICGLFTSEGEPIIVDQDENDRCGFKLSPPETVDVIIAVQNTGSSSVHVTVVAR